MSGLAVGFGIDSNCVQAHFLSGIDDTAGDLSTVGDQRAPDIYGLLIIVCFLSLPAVLPRNEKQGSVFALSGL